MSTDPTAPLTSECVLWTGHVRSDGYGQAKRGKGGLAHRYLWVQAHGPIPVGKEIHHICGNRTCVNLDHLEPLTRREHMLKDGRTERAAALGRLNPPRRWDHVTPGEPVTHCIRGHAYDEVNTYVYKGARFCRACHRASALRGYHAARQ